jgi:hypothetical protein
VKKRYCSVHRPRATRLLYAKGKGKAINALCQPQAEMSYAYQSRNVLF